MTQIEFNYKPNSKPTQCYRILRHLKLYKSITDLEALRDYGIRRLSARIHELRKEHTIDDCWIIGENRFGEKTKWKKYIMEGK